MKVSLIYFVGMGIVAIGLLWSILHSATEDTDKDY